MIRYLFDLPRRLRPGRVLVHNHVRSTRQRGEPDFDKGPFRDPGEFGFRIWTQSPSESPKLERCHCGWRPEIGPHFRVRSIMERRRRKGGKS